MRTRNRARRAHCARSGYPALRSRPCPLKEAMIQIATLREIWGSRYFVAIGFAILCPAPSASAYSVLTHEAIIDSTWDSAIKPLLVRRFPVATSDELNKAHAYSYGGCIIQDLGYYPFGNKFFSDLTHYVRSGDFVINLINDSQGLNEYAFALGALAHYAADNNGHPMAVNLAVPVLYPNLRRKFGRSVTYADDPFSHAKTEFAFDVYQAAKGRYAPVAYKDFIGFEVSKPLLDRAFQNTYGMTLDKVFMSVDLALGSYRHSVGTILPAMTRVAWKMKEKEIRKDTPSVTRKLFIYNLSRSSYEKNWGKSYARPGFRSELMAFLFRLVPKVGPFRPLSFRSLTPETEKMYMASFNSTITRYRELLSEQNLERLKLPNENLDVGVLTAEGKYKLTDATYSQLLHKLQEHYAEMPQTLRSDILTFYHDPSASTSTPTDQKGRAVLVDELGRLRALDTGLLRDSPALAGAPAHN